MPRGLSLAMAQSPTHNRSAKREDGSSQAEIVMPISRREFVGLGVAGAVARGAMADRARASGPTGGRSIDRVALVRRHNPTIRRVDPFAALSVGNGTLAFTADVTGLQTFADVYRAQFPLCTVAHWGW